MFGVYSIINKTNGCVYIGSTAKSIRRRWDLHRSMLKRGVHYNIHLQRAWDKYGEDAFEFLILEEMANKEEVTKHEQTWLDLHRMDGDVYNIAMYVTATTLGYKFTDEQKQDISERLAIYHPMRGKHFSAQVKQNMKEGIRKHGPSFLGRRHTEETKEKIRQAHIGRVFSEEHCKNISRSKKGLINACSKPYPAFYNIITGEIIPPGINLAQVCREYGLAASSLGRVKRGRVKTHKGWRLR